MEFFPHTSDNRGGEDFFACHTPPIHQEILLLIHPPLFTHSPPLGCTHCVRTCEFEPHQVLYRREINTALQAKMIPSSFFNPISLAW